jgi:hypothetical protein
LQFSIRRCRQSAIRNPKSAMGLKLYSLDHLDVPPLELPPRFRLELPFFITPAGSGSAPARLPENEYWIELADAKRWLDDGVVYVVSPLDAENKAEIELTEDHEQFLEWLVKHQIQHVRVG